MTKARLITPTVELRCVHEVILLVICRSCGLSADAILYQCHVDLAFYNVWNINTFNASPNLHLNSEISLNFTDTA
jgi:hypothetical protein